MNVNDILISEPENEYHSKAGECLSSHLLAMFRDCPLMYHLTMKGAYQRPDSEAYALGRAVHTLVLEGSDKYKERYDFESPVNPATGNPYGNTSKKYEEWATSVRLNGMEPISRSDNLLAAKMQMSVVRHKEASILLQQAPHREKVIRAPVMGVDCQTRMDAYGEDVGIGDLKTIENLSKFYWQVKNFGYVYQMSFYRMVARIAGLPCPSVHFIVIEKQFPYRTGVWKVEESSLDMAEEENQQAVEDLKVCKKRGEWPTKYEDVRLLSV